MFPTKALGLDGFHALFYQKYWDIKGLEVLRVVLSFLNGNISMMELNETFLVIILNVKDPKKITRISSGQLM